MVINAGYPKSGNPGNSGNQKWKLEILGNQETRETWIYAMD
jgi:hypothetical protein